MENIKTPEELRDECASSENLGKKEFDTITRDLNNHAARLIIDNMDQTQVKNDENLKRRLEMDLLTNATADYSRINLTEVFTMFNFNVEHTITHWRLAKIMDAMTVCNRELKIIDYEIKPKEIPGKIYDAFRRGQQDTENIKVEIEIKADEATPAKKEVKEVSLVDFAYFADVMKANRELGVYRIPVNELAAKFFTGQELKVSVENEKGKKAEVDLKDQSINPKDNYQNIDIEGYIAEIKNRQVGLQKMGQWRWNAEGHREKGGHASNVLLDGKLWWIPGSGEQAQVMTLADLQKVDGGLKGQPQEVGDMDEGATGVVVRMRMPFLEQRKREDYRKLNRTPRLAKAMVGHALDKEEASSQVEEDTSADGQTKKIVYLCGKKQEGEIIKAMRFHYNKAAKKIRGFELSKEEAADMAFTDVFAPCIINNENDWLISLSQAYGLTQKGSNVLVQNKYTEFPGFIIKMMARDMDAKELKFKMHEFKNMAELKNYLNRRILAGHINQPMSTMQIESARKQVKAVAPSNEYLLYGGRKEQKKLFTKEVAGAMSELFKYVLGPYGEEYIKEYVQKGEKALLPSMRAKIGAVVGEKIPHGEKAAYQRTLPFHEIVLEELMKMSEEEGKTLEIIELIHKIFPDVDPDSLEEDDANLEAAIKGIVETLKILPENERKKIRY